MKSKEEILSNIFHRPETQDWYKPVLAAMELYTQQSTPIQEWESVWVEAKPEFKNECTFVTAVLINGVWDYKVFQIGKVYHDDGWYWGWLNGDGEEYGDIEDISSDKYLILPPIERHTPQESKEGEAIALLKEYEQWEADLIMDNEMWWPYAEKDKISGKTYDKMMELQEKRNAILELFKNTKTT